MDAFESNSFLLALYDDCLCILACFSFVRVSSFSDQLGILEIELSASAKANLLNQFCPNEAFECVN